MTSTPIPQRSLGTTSVGAIALGGAWWSLVPSPDEVLATATVRAAVDVGVTLFDTAPAYTSGMHRSHNETLIGAVLRDELADGRVVVSTKGGHTRAPDGTFLTDARPDTLRRHCEASLRALATDVIPLYSLHWPDPTVPLVESVGALAGLREEGKVRMVGVCNVTPAQLGDAMAVTTIDAVQHRLTPLDRANRALVRRCAEAGTTFLAYSPFGGREHARALGRDPSMAAIATRRGVSPYQVAIAWLLGQPGVVPVVGAGRPRSIIDAAGGASLVLTEGELASITTRKEETQ